eukprot:TRINITY_DN2173_c0_g1_i1.p1 TRINITY_DN2173_c0_g1~~TRINITY_DN2173_c0_g1_i1.p1  ORF type:complete len:1007 (+),score=223.57 TRINITY_DN2173_c0_g1_i1:353-3022(+)
MIELKLLSDDTQEEHGGTLTASWEFKEAPPTPEQAPASVPDPVPAVSAPSPVQKKSGEDDEQAAKAALIREMEEQDKKEAIRQAELDELNKKRDALLASLSSGTGQATNPLQQPPSQSRPLQQLEAQQPKPVQQPQPQVQQPQPVQQPQVQQPQPVQQQSQVQQQPQPQMQLAQPAPVTHIPLSQQQMDQPPSMSARVVQHPAQPLATQPVKIEQVLQQAPTEQQLVVDAPVERRPDLRVQTQQSRQASPQPTPTRPPKSPSLTDTAKGTVARGDPGSTRSSEPIVAMEVVKKTANPEVDKKIAELLRKKQEAVNDERYLEAQRLKEEIDAFQKQAERSFEKSRTTIATGGKVTIVRRLDLASGRVISVGDVGEVISAPGKPAVVQFAAADVCFATDGDDVEPIKAPVSSTIPGLPSAVAREAAHRQAVADAPVQKEFIQGAPVRSKRLIQFENGKSVEKGALGYAIKVPGSLAIVKVNGCVFSVDDGDVELYTEPKKVSISEPPRVYEAPRMSGDVSIPWVEVPQHISLTPGREFRQTEVPMHTPSSMGHVAYPEQSYGMNVDVTELPQVAQGQYHVVVCPADGVDIVIRNIHPQDTVMKLKRLVQKANNVAASQQCLSQELVNGSMCTLDDRRTLASYDVRTGDRLVLTIPTGVVPISFRLPNGRLCKMSGVKLDDTVLAVKRKIHDIANIPISRQRLVLGSTGEELQDRKTLSMSKVVAGSEVFIEEKDGRKTGAVRVGALRLHVIDEIGDRESRTFGRSLPLHCSADDTVMSAKRFLGGRLGIGAQALELRHHGVPLRDMQKMRDVLQGSTTGLSLAYKTATHSHSDLHQQVTDLRATASTLASRNAALNTSISTIRDRNYGFSPDPYSHIHNMQARQTSPRRNF